MGGSLKGILFLCRGINGVPIFSETPGLFHRDLPEGQGRFRGSRARREARVHGLDALHLSGDASWLASGAEVVGLGFGLGFRV